MRTKRINPQSEQLTSRERAAMRFIQAYMTTSRFHQAPHYQEIQAAIGLSLGATHGLVQRLIEWGYLTRQSKYRSSRNLRVARAVE